MTTATQTTTSTEAGTAFESLAVNPDGIPQRLKERPQWVVWKLEKRDGELTKVPYSPWSLSRASSTDLMTWATFEGAMIIYQKHGLDGIGFVFCSADPFVGIDFDKCRDPETGKIDEDVQGFVRNFKTSYIEVSVSGTGIHLITTGRCKNGKKAGNREVYGQDRFFCMTGEVVNV